MSGRVKLGVRKHDWRSFLNEDEAAAVLAAERKCQNARQDLAEAAIILGPIRNRAIQRSRFAGRAALKAQETKPPATT